MSWGFGNAAPQVTAGSDLEEISTDALGFLTIAGDTKLRLLPQPWPADNLPPTHASLFSVASSKGLIAAAGPSSLVIASTDSVREAYLADTTAENNVKPFTPQATISIPQVSHVAFSSDESSLVIAAQEGGGLAVYEVQALLQGKQESAFQLPTNSTSIRALAPNPAPESAHLFAIVLTDGKLMVADLKQGQLINTSNGPVFRDGVTCVSWSAKGKQLVAGLQDGSAVQYDPQGNVKAQIPKPPQITDQLPMSCIYWVANDDFMVIHTPLSGDDTDSTYHMLHRDKASGTFSAQKFAIDPCPAFGLRLPAHYFISRLRNFPPSLDDMLILSSTAAIDLGVFTKASAPLAPDLPMTNTYTTTGMANDSRRAQLPMSADDGMGDTSTIGMDLDLSAKNRVVKPIPQEEMDESATPLPALMLLNHEGVLSTWWIVYNESIRQKTAFPGLISAVSTQPATAAPAQTAPTAATASSPAPSAFGAFGKPAQSSSLNTSAFGKPAQPAFGSASTPGFGGASAMGAKASPWGAPAASSPGQKAAPTFGSATPLTSAGGNAGFGAPSGIGKSTSVWGTPSGGQQSTGSVFGQSSIPQPSSAASGSSGFAKFGAPSAASPFAAAAGGENKPVQSPFASFGGDKPSASPFAKLADSDKPKSPFASLGGGDANKASPFASASPGEAKKSPFGSFGQASGAFGSPSALGAKASPFAAAAPVQSQSASATQEEAMDDEEDEKPEGEEEKKEAEKPKPSFFGSNLPRAQTSIFNQASDKPQQSVFGQPSKPASSIFAQASDKPKTSLFGQASDKPASPLFGKPSSPSLSRQTSQTSKLPTFTGFKLGSTFKPDENAKNDDEPSSKKDGGSLFGSGFGNMLGEATKEKQKSPEPIIKQEPGSREPSLKDLPESKPEQTVPAEKEASVEPEEAPLPPDFTTWKPKQQEEEDIPPIAGSPPVDLADEASQLSPPASEGDDEAQGPPDESDDESWQEESDGEEEEEEEEDENGDDEDEEDDEESDEDEEEVEYTVDADKAAKTSFGSRLSFPTQSFGEQPKSPFATSTTPAGLPKGPFFAPPTKTQESPRSPSPVRATSSTPSGRPASRSTSKPITVPSMKGHVRTHSRPSSAQRPASPPPEPEAGELSDDEDVRVREILASEIEPTKELEPFIAHQDYIGHVSKPGIGGQIEKVYRDINSMLDTLGMNARSLEAFVKGHESKYKEAGRERSDLEDSEDWCLVEVSDLGVVGNTIGKDLESGKVDGVREKIEELSELNKDANRLRAKVSDMRKQIGSRADPQQRAVHRASPLNTEAQMQQTELRQGIAKVQKLLQDAEEALSVLRADLAAAPTQGTAAQRVPTVEAVTNTIMKMTAMIEQKSGDVDVLEAQIRRLPNGVASLSLNDSEDNLRSSVRSVRPLNGAGRSSSPFGTPPATRGKGHNATPLGLSGMLGRFGGSVQKSRSTYGFSYSPDATEEFGRSSVVGSARKKMTDVSSEEVQRYQDKVQQRKRVLGALKATVEKKGTRVTGVASK